MKKQILTACSTAALLLMCNTSNAQSFTTNGNKAEANSGIDQIHFQQSTSAVRSIRGNTTNGYFELYSNNSNNDGPSIIMYNNGYSNPSYGSKGLINFTSTDNNTSSFQNHERAFEFTHFNTAGPTWASLLSINKNGFVGIGMPPSTSNTAELRLSIRGNILMESPWSSLPEADRGIRTGNSDARLALFGGFNEFDGAFIKLNGSTHAADPNKPENKGSIDFVANADAPGDDDDIAFSFTTYDGNAGNDWTTHAVLRNDGKMVIGKDNIYNYYRNGITDRIPTGYLLYVEEGILTEKVKVALRNDPSNWSDFVFADDYELRSINDVEEYIVKNKHLPEIPSTEEVLRDGLDLAKMDAKLLQKIEELTLYIIQQQKDINELKVKLNK